MKINQFDPNEELDLAAKMLMKGRKAAAFDGIHMIIWGAIGALTLLLQYFAEVKDWLPSSILWLWQPALLISVVMTLFMGRKSLISRMRNPIVRIYSASFGAAGLSLFVYAISGSGSGQPNAHTFSILLCTSLASAFFVMGIATNLRQLLVASAGWWLGTIYFGLKGVVTPIDFIVLSDLLTLCVVLPGIMLKTQNHAPVRELNHLSNSSNTVDNSHEC